MKRRETKELLDLEFENALEFIERAESSVNSPWERTLESRWEGDYRTDWTKTRTFEEAVKLARYGWSDGIDKLERNIDIIEEQNLINYEPIPHKKKSVAGFMPHIPRTLAGEPENMVTRTRPKDEKTKPVIKIALRLSYSYKIEANDVIKWGAVFASYIRELEELGYKIHVTATNELIPDNCSKAFKDCNTTFKDGRGPDLAFHFPLKKPDERLSLPDLVFWTAHPSALRRMVFAVMECEDIEEYYKSHYGRVSWVRDYPKDVLTLSIEAQDNLMGNVNQLKDQIESHVSDLTVNHRMAEYEALAIPELEEELAKLQREERGSSESLSARLNHKSNQQLQEKLKKHIDQKRKEQNLPQKFNDVVHDDHGPSFWLFRLIWRAKKAYKRPVFKLPDRQP